MLGQVGKLLGRGVTARWSPYSGAAVHLDFINRKYYWDGAERLETDFTTFTGATFGTGADAGLIGTGTGADYDIRLLWSLLNITAPFVMAVVFKPTLLNGTLQFIVNIGGTNEIADRVTMSVSTANRFIPAAVNTSVTQFSHNVAPDLVAGSIYAGASLIQTNMARSSINGATYGAEDNTVAVPALVTLRLMERNADASPFTGRVRHVLFFQQTGGAEISQAGLNTLSGELATL